MSGYKIKAHSPKVASGNFHPSLYKAIGNRKKKSNIQFCAHLSIEMLSSTSKTIRFGTECNYLFTENGPNDTENIRVYISLRHLMDKIVANHCEHFDSFTAITLPSHTRSCVTVNNRYIELTIRKKQKGLFILVDLFSFQFLFLFTKEQRNVRDS